MQEDSPQTLHLSVPPRSSLIIVFCQPCYRYFLIRESTRNIPQNKDPLFCRQNKYILTTKPGDLFYLKYKYSLLIETDTVVFYLSVVDHRLDSLESYTICVRSIQRTDFLSLVELLTIFISCVYFEHIYTVVTFNRSTYLVNLSHRNHSVQVRVRYRYQRYGEYQSSRTSQSLQKNPSFQHMPQLKLNS